MASRSALLRLDDDEVPFGAPSLARDCAASREPAAIRIDDTYVEYFPLPLVPPVPPGPPGRVQSTDEIAGAAIEYFATSEGPEPVPPGAPLRHEPPLPGEEDEA